MQFHYELWPRGPPPYIRHWSTRSLPARAADVGCCRLNSEFYTEYRNKNVKIKHIHACVV